MPGEEELQKVFREAAETLGKRVLCNRQLVWKPGAKDQLLTNIRAAKMLLSNERKQLNATWKTAKPADIATPRQRVAMGGHRSPPPKPAAPAAQPATASASWTAAKPSAARRPDAPVIGTRRADPSLLNDVSMAALKMGTVMGAVELLHEGAVSGTDILLDPDFSRPMLEAGWHADGGPLAEKTISGFADMLSGSGLFEDASIEAGKEIAGEIASCLPVIGAVITLSEAAVQTINLALDLHRRHTLKKDAVHITPGQPRAALEAARRLYARHATEMGARMAINYTAGGAAVGGLFLDFGAVTGPLAGIIKSVLNLVITITNSCITLAEMRKGNEIIRDGGPFDVTLIEKCPILGAYLLTEAESSVLYAFLLDAPLPRNWQDEIMKVKPKIDEVTRIVNVLQRRSPFQLAGGTTSGSFAKGDHFLDMRIHKTPQRVMHEANLVARRDPNSLKFLERHTKETKSAKLPGGKG